MKMDKKETRKRLHEKIKTARDSIKKKSLALKIGEEESEKLSRKLFRPILSELKKNTKEGVEEFNQENHQQTRQVETEEKRTNEHEEEKEEERHRKRKNIRPTKKNVISSTLNTRATVKRQLKKILTPRKSQTAMSGGNFKNVTNKPVEFVYFDDVNEIIERLLLLHSAQNAGDSKTNEIMSIESELKERKIIK
uniref:Uncharacterized protein n=1 Tax=Cacopsylla melanoneura TaxID=428564 RepID=A0A8D9F9S4_9HEMI